MAVFKPAQSSDDCYLADGWGIILDDAALPMGNYVGSPYDVGIRFPNNIPKGATILSAKVTFQAVGQGLMGCNIQIKGEASDNAATFSTTADYNARARTISYVNWDNVVAWPYPFGSDYDSPDISPIIQEIINRSGYGTNLALFFADHTSSTYAYRVAASYENDPNLCPRLTVTWVIHDPLSAEGGTFIVTGQPLTLLYGRSCAIGIGSYSLVGHDVDLIYVPTAQPTIFMAEGSFIIAGSDVALRASRKIDLEAGSFAVAGSDVAFSTGLTTFIGWKPLTYSPSIWTKVS